VKWRHFLDADDLRRLTQAGWCQHLTMVGIIESLQDGEIEALDDTLCQRWLDTEFA